jgi:hypothetical protein
MAEIVVPDSTKYATEKLTERAHKMICGYAKEQRILEKRKFQTASNGITSM